MSKIKTSTIYQVTMIDKRTGAATVKAMNGADYQAAMTGEKPYTASGTEINFLRVSSMAEAWQAANDLFPTDYMLDGKRSARAGYPIHYSTAEGVNAYICDLGDRLELNFSDGSSFNVWVEDEKPSTADPEPVKASAPVRLADLIPLRCKVTIYVPSTVNVNQAADNTAQVERVARFMSDAFGGATASPVSGYWVAADSSLVAERTTMVFAYCTSEQAEKYIDDIVRLCVAIRDEMGQEAVALEYNGSMYFI